MTRENIKKRILAYIKTENTNYAMMISGEWGTGKTYLLQNKEDGIMEAISQISIPDSNNNKFRPIYVSLSGISTIDRLKELMFASINLRPQNLKTKLEFEIVQFDNEKSDKDFKPKSPIPENIVFCFDDLERVFPPFLEELLGYINTYIEHSGNKVLFVCDETKIKEYFKEDDTTSQKDFDIIKEKYIRRNYKLKTNLDVILNNQELSEHNKIIVRNTFQEGRCNNLRTLQFTLEILDEILVEFDRIKTNIAKEYHKKLEELIVFYTAFVSIEYKKGIPYDIIKRVTFPVNNRILSFDEQGMRIILPWEASTPEQVEETKEQKETIERIKNQVNDIENLYFPEMKDHFANLPQREPFDSIGEFVDSGEFKIEKFRIEIEKIVASLIRREGTEDEEIRQNINRIYDVPDVDARNIIGGVLESIKNTSYTKLSTYLFIFSDLLVLESHKIHDSCVDKGVTRIFINSIQKSLDSKSLEREPFLYEQTSGNWTIKSIQADKFHRFRDCILKVNENLDNKAVKDSSVEAIIKAIDGTYENMQLSIVDDKENYTLKEVDALPVFERLKECTSRTIHTFRDALDRRYALSGGQTQAFSERGFIKKMLELVDKHLNSIDKNRPISYIGFYNLKEKIEYWIKYYSLNHE